MPRRGENIYLRRDGRWEGRIIIGRKENRSCRYRSIYGKSYHDVKEKMTVERAKLLLFPGQCRGAGTRSAAAERHYDIPRKPDVPFGFLAEDWLVAKRSQVKESTYVRYQNLVSSYISPGLGEIEWKALNRETVEAFCRGLLVSGGMKQAGLSPKTVSDILSVLRSIFRYASDLGYEAAFDLSSVVVRKEQKETPVLTRKEQERLCKVLRAAPNNRDIGLLIGLSSGVRLGELCALRGEDISLTEQTIRVHRTMQRIQTWDDSGRKTKIVITPPKSRDSVRTIPMPNELAGLLVEYKRQKTGYVLTGRGDAFVEPRTMERYFAGVLRKAGIRKVNFHALRHTFATRCVEMDFDVKSLSEILGHSTVNITMNRYVHPSMELKRRNMQRLSELLAVSESRQSA